MDALRHSRPAPPTAGNAWTLALVAMVLLTLALAWLSRPERTTDQPAPAPSPTTSALPPSDRPALAGVVRWRPTSASRQLQVIDHGIFTVGYDNQRRNPAWVVYELDGPIAYPGREPARPGFATDLATTARVSSDDFSHAGADRGHLCPAYAMFSRHGPTAFAATFTMSNVVPQLHAMNAGVWQDLEVDIAGRSGRGGGWAESLRHVTVINGPLFAEPPARLPSGVPVPSACFSVVLDLVESTGGWRVLALRIPNQAGVGGPLRRHLTTVRSLERESGLDLLAGAPADVRASLEDATAEAVWAGLEP